MSARPRLVEIYRSASAIWVVIDGHPLPTTWITSAFVDINDDRPPQVTLHLDADRVVVDNSMFVTDPGEVTDGETDSQGQAQTSGERVRVPE